MSSNMRSTNLWRQTTLCPVVNDAMLRRVSGPFFLLEKFVCSGNISTSWPSGLRQQDAGSQILGGDTAASGRYDAGELRMYTPLGECH